MLSTSSKASSSTPGVQAHAGTMSLLKEKMEISKKIKIEPGTTPVKFNSPSNPMIKTIKVEFMTEHFVEEDNGDQTVVAATVVNIFGLKDKITGKEALEPDGDLFSWPGKMIYISTVQGLLRADGVDPKATADLMTCGHGFSSSQT